MSPFNILLIFLCLGISYRESDAQVAGFRLVLTWPPALCSVDSTRCHNLVRNFTIHGLWPYNSAGTSLINCNGTNFNVTNVAGFESDLNQAWPSFKKGSSANRNGWKYQWDKHGKCSEGILNQTRFFKNAMIRRNSIKLEAVLARATKPPGGIIPNNGTYKVQDILDAMPNKTQVRVNCKTNAAKKVLYYETFICLNTTGSIINCTGPQEANCGGTTANITYLA